MILDCAGIDSGPAGLNAALMLGCAKRKVNAINIVIDKYHIYRCQ